MRFAAAAAILGVLVGCSREPRTTDIRPAEKSTTEQNVPSPYGADFWQTWGDGQAEVAAYDLTMPRYGQPRKGTAIAITVSEPFSNSARVKADEGKHSGADVFSAMKLNLIREYQTGIYNYNDMLSVFVALEDVNRRAAGKATKITFSSQEWCGHVWSELLFGPARIEQMRHSYFDGEGDSQRVIEEHSSGIPEDTLMLAARRIAWPRLRLGQSYVVHVLTSLETERAQHVGLRFFPATLFLSKVRRTTTVPAGSFRTNEFRVKREDGFTWTYSVEADPPFRVIRWENSTGEHAELIGSARMEYWEMNAEGGEKALEKLGLTRRGPRMP
jgi:hypothetical protein